MTGYYHPSKRFFPSPAECQERYLFAAKKIAQSFETDGESDSGLVGDMACGIGESSWFLKDQLNKQNIFPHIVGVDLILDPNKISKGDDVTLLNADLGDRDLINKLEESVKAGINFDVIACIETLEHVFPPDKAETLLQNLHMLLKNKKGLLILSVPNRRFFANDRYHPYSPYHAQEFNSTELTELLTRAGFGFEMYGQRIVPSKLIEFFDGLRIVADRNPRFRRKIGKIISATTNIGQLNPKVTDWSDRKNFEPKYFVAVCQPLE